MKKRWDLECFLLTPPKILCGITLADDSLDEIESTIVYLSELPEDWHREHSIRTREVAEEKFSEKAFMNRWREIMSEILKIHSDPHD